MNRKITLLVLLLTAMALAWMPEASAIAQYLTAFEANYSSAVGTRIDQCLICHTNPFGGARNPYGTHSRENGHNFTIIEQFDSDGDGFANIDEIHNRTFPGEAIDFPQVSASHTTDAPIKTTINGAPQTEIPPTSRFWILYVVAPIILIAARIFTRGAR